MSYTRHINVMTQDVMRCPKCRSLVGPGWFLEQWSVASHDVDFVAEHGCGHIWRMQCRDLPVLLTEVDAQHT